MTASTIPDVRFRAPHLPAQGRSETSTAGKRRRAPRLRRRLWSVDRQHFSALTGFESIEIVGPCLHHFLAFGQALRLVLGGAHFVPLGVRQLQLDDIRREPQLVEQRARHAAKAVTGLLVAPIAEPA